MVTVSENFWPEEYLKKISMTLYKRVGYFSTDKQQQNDNFVYC